MTSVLVGPGWEAAAPDRPPAPPPPSGAGFDRAVRLATSPYFETPDAASVRPSTALTVAGWFRFPDTQNSGDAFNGLVFKSFGTASPWLSWAIQTLGVEWEYRFRISDGTTIYETNPMTVAPGSWLYLAGTWQSGQQLALRAWDEAGTIVGSVVSPTTVSATIGYSTEPLYVGRNEAAARANVEATGILVAHSVLSDPELFVHRDSATVPAAAQLHAELGATNYGPDAVNASNLVLVNAAQAPVVSGPDDTTGPVVSNVGLSATASTITVTFDTDELVDPAVDFGLTTAYGSQQTGPAGTSHSITISGLTASTTYHVRIQGTDTGGNQTFDVDRTQATAALSAPPQPTGLVASGGNGQVLLDWTDTPDADTYNVLRSTTSGSGYVQQASGLLVSAHTDAAVTNGTPYFYVVEAVNPAGTSPQSAEASATPSASQTWEDAWATNDFTVIRDWFRANTGIAYAGLTDGDLTPSGSISSSANNQVIEGLLVTGSILVSHDNVTIRNCKIVNSGASNPVEVPFSALGSVSRITLENVTCLGTQDGLSSYAIGIHTVYVANGLSIPTTNMGLRASRVYIAGFGGGYRLDPNSDARVEYSMVENIKIHPQSHNTGSSFRGGTGKDYYRCFLEGSTSSALSLYPDNRPILDLRVEECLFDGGTYSIHGGDDKTYGNQTTAAFVNNKFTRDYLYGPLTSFNKSLPGRTWSGNAHLDGAAIP